MIVYENDGHRRRMMKMYPQFAWKMMEWRRDPTCRHCQKEMYIEAREGKWKDQATVDHVIAQCLGGVDLEENWALLCGSCNNKKSKLENQLMANIQAIKKGLDISRKM